MPLIRRPGSSSRPREHKLVNVNSTAWRQRVYWCRNGQFFTRPTLQQPSNEQVGSESSIDSDPTSGNRPLRAAEPQNRTEAV